jgi:hypothetical protein
LNLAWPFSESPNANTLLVPIETDSIDVTVETMFIDYDFWSVDDVIAYYRARHQYPSLQNAQAILGCGKRFESDWLTEEESQFRVSYTLTVFPNPCLDFPLGIPLPKAPWASS